MVHDIRKDKIRKEIESWRNLSDDLIIKEIDKISDLGRHGTFVSDVYPNIQKVGISDNINRILLTAAVDSAVNIEVRVKFIYICAELNLQGAEEATLKTINYIGDLEKIKNTASVFGFLNAAIRKLNLRKASNFLCDQLNLYFRMPKEQREVYYYLGSAIWVLKDINSEKAASYWNKLGISSYVNENVSNWDKYSDEELKDTVKKIIIGYGLDGMAAGNAYIDFIPKYYTKINNITTKERINKILFELIDDSKSSYAAGAIYICSTLQLMGIKEILLGIIDKVDNILKYIEEANDIRDRKFLIFIQYLSALNMAIGRLRISESKDYLIEQLSLLKKPVPLPLTKEYYIYQICGRSAFLALKEIEPELAKNYDFLM